MLGDICFALWFFLPAALANMAPIIAVKISWLVRFKAPMDGGHTFRGKRILGDNKTWRGLISGVVVATITLALQQFAMANTTWFGGFTDQVDYAALPTLLLGPLFAFGALGGDAVKSFFKRQLNAKPGKPWPVADQIGEIVGAALITAPFAAFSMAQYVWVIVIWIAVDLGISTMGYLIGWKERPV